MNTKKIIAVVLSAFALGVSAQQLPMYNQYTALPYLYNPSLVGASGNVNASLLHRAQWRGIPGAPVTSVFTAEGAIQEKNMGLGTTVFNDNTDIIQRVGFYGLYSYNLKLNEDQKLLFGLSFGVQNQRIDFTRAVIKDANDPYLMFTTAQRKTFVDATLGATYAWKTLEVGLTVPQLFGNKVEYNNTTGSSWYYTSRHFMMTAKYTHVLNEEKGMSIYPLLLLRYAKGAPVQYEFNAVFDWAKRGWAGLSYKSNYAVGINVGFRVNNSLRAGYAFDYSINSVKNFIGGAHEFFLGYTFGGTKEKEEPTSPLAGNNTKSDSLLNDLYERDQKQKEEIAGLKDELSKLKQSADSVKKVVTPLPGMMPASTNDFKTESGQKIKSGFYVVIGAFKSISNAENAKATVSAKYPNASLILNDKRGLHYVYLLTTDHPEIAEEAMQAIQAQFPDAWIYDMK